MFRNSAVNLPLLHQGRLGGIRTPLGDLPDGTVGLVTATITTIRRLGRGSSLHFMFGMTGDDGTVGVAHLPASKVGSIPDFLRTWGAHVTLRGHVRRDVDLPYFQIEGISPA